MLSVLGALLGAIQVQIPPRCLAPRGGLFIGTRPEGLAPPHASRSFRRRSPMIRRLLSNAGARQKHLDREGDDGAERA
jgi:hypothetical protein